MIIELVEPIVHDVEQRTEEWFNLRLGRITGSKIPSLMPSSKQNITDFTDTQKKILKEIAVERLTGVREEPFSNSYMQWGTDTEPLAKDYYELETMQIVDNIGFITYLNHLGDSPDGITNEKAVEFKCPKSTTHLDYLRDSTKLVKAYKWQCINHILHAKKESCDLVSFDPRFPQGKKIVIVNIPRKKEEISFLLERMEICNQYIESLVHG